MPAITGHEVYYPFYGSILTVIAGGLFALWQARPKAQTDKFSALVRAYSELNQEFRTDNERLRAEVAKLKAALDNALTDNIVLRDSVRDKERQIAALTKEKSKS